MKSAMATDALASAGLPGVSAVWCHEAGGGRAIIVVALEQRYAGHSRQAGYLAAQLPVTAYMNRLVITVDADVDPRDLHEVMWAVSTRCDPARDIDIMRYSWGCVTDPLSLPGEPTYNSRALIDACRRSSGSPTSPPWPRPAGRCSPGWPGGGRNSPRDRDPGARGGRGHRPAARAGQAGRRDVRIERTAAGRRLLTRGPQPGRGGDAFRAVGRCPAQHRAGAAHRPGRDREAGRRGLRRGGPRRGHLLRLVPHRGDGHHPLLDADAGRGGHRELRQPAGAGRGRHAEGAAAASSWSPGRRR